MRTNHLRFGPYCSYWLWQEIDNRAWGKTETDGVIGDVAYRDSFSTEKFRKTLDFSGFVVTNIHDGRQYRAASITGPDPESFNQQYVTVNLEYIP